MKSPSHPIWSLLRLVAYMAALTIILWAHAQNFDETELKALFWFFLTLISTEGVTSLTKKLTDKGS